MEKCPEPLALESCNCIGKSLEIETSTSCEYLFNSKDDMHRSLTRLCHGNLYVIGKIWIEALKFVLVGSKISLVPVVQAAEKEKPLPQRPPPMKYTDLSIYNSPHYEYKDYVEDQSKCAGNKEKILFKYLLPKVKETRKEASESFSELRATFKEQCKNICCSISCKKKRFKAYMRDSENLPLRQALVASSAVVGFIVGRRLGTYKDSLLKGIFYSGLGVLATGALCFPKETDVHFREACHHTAKTSLMLYNLYCRKNSSLKQKLPCEADFPEKPKPKPQQCPEKKK